jgi:nucleoside 2-deoxyribosyltransferase
MSFKNVYVSHSAAQDIGPVRRLIEEEGATVLGSYDISSDISSPREISTVLNRDIESANAVIAIVSSGADNVLFELGCAVALRKPLLVLMSPGAKLPSFLQNATHFTSDLAESPVLRLGIKQFLSDAFHRSKLLRLTLNRAVHVDEHEQP